MLALFCTVAHAKAQTCTSANIQHQTDIPSTCNTIAMTMLHDQMNRPYLYVANKSGGLVIHDISNITAPIAIDTIPTSLFDTLDVMNLSQDGNYLYLAVGNHFTNPQSGGMVIIDITDPATASVTDYYIIPNSNSGAGIVKTEGNYAYLGGMKSGLIILDISDKNNIVFNAQYIPDINYPVNNPNPDLYNARGMAVKNDIVYLCYDAGGLRIINCEDKSNPFETGHYANPSSYNPINLPRAYNNIILDDTLVYISVDYCGLEVLNVSDTSDITLTGWWNPYNCPNNNWFSSPSHTNELAFNKACDQLFVSTGKSDMIVLDLSDPTQPDSCNYYGGISNNIGTWGVSTFQDKIFLSYICAIIPFSSNWTGVKILTYNQCTAFTTEMIQEKFEIYPNPAQNVIQIRHFNQFDKNTTIIITNSRGQTMDIIQEMVSNTLSIDHLSNGLYFLSVINDGQVETQRFVVEH